MAASAPSQELAEIEQDVKASMAGVAEVLRPYCRRPLQLSIILMVFSQVNGVNMMLLYAPTILNAAGVSFGSHSVLSVIADLCRNLHRHADFVPVDSSLQPAGNSHREYARHGREPPVDVRAARVACAGSVRGHAR